MFLYLCRMCKRGYYSVRAGGFQTPQEGTNLLPVAILAQAILAQAILAQAILAQGWLKLVSR